MTISKRDFWSFINELVTRNPNLGIPALEDGLFANLLVFTYLYYIFFCLGRERKGKGKGKGKGKAKGKGKGKEKGKGKGKGREGKREKGKGPCSLVNFGISFVSGI